MHFIHLRPTGGGGDDSRSFYCMYYGSRKTMRLGKRRQVVQRAPHTSHKYASPCVSVARAVQEMQHLLQRTPPTPNANKLNASPGACNLDICNTRINGRCNCAVPLPMFDSPTCQHFCTPSMLAAKLIAFARCTSSWKILSIWLSLNGEAICYSSLICINSRIDTENMKFLLASAVFVEAEINRLLMTNEMEWES